MAFVARIGESRKLKHTIYIDTPFVVENVFCTLYSSTGERVVLDAAGAVDNATEATEHTIWYLWQTTGFEAGDYTYDLKYTIDGETLIEHGEVTLLSPCSAYDPYVKRIAELVMERGGNARSLTYIDYRDAGRSAVARYQQLRPQRLVQDYTLVANKWEYDLPTHWVPDFSYIDMIEYPVNEDRNYQMFLEASEYSVDEERGKWRIFGYQIGSEDTARVYYKTTHLYTDARVTVPDKDFESVCQYAAGMCLIQLGNLASQMGQPAYGEGVQVDYKARQPSLQSQGEKMMERAEKIWGAGGSATVATLNYLEHHGRIIYPYLRGG